MKKKMLKKKEKEKKEKKKKKKKRLPAGRVQFFPPFLFCFLPWKKKNIFGDSKVLGPGAPARPFFFTSSSVSTRGERREREKKKTRNK